MAIELGVERDERHSIYRDDTGAGATFLNAPGNTPTANVAGTLKILHGRPATSCAASNTACKYFDTTAFQQVTATTPGVLDGFFGNAGRDIVRGPGYFNLDMGVMRNFRLTQRFTFQF